MIWTFVLIATLIIIILIFVFLCFFSFEQAYKVIELEKTIQKLTGYPVKNCEFDQILKPNVSSDKLPGVKDLEIMRDSYKGNSYPVNCTINYYDDYIMKIFISHLSIVMTVINIKSDPGYIMAVNFDKNKGNAFTRFYNYFYNHYQQSSDEVKMINIFAYPRLEIKNDMVRYYVTKNSYYNIIKVYNNKLVLKNGFAITTVDKDEIIQTYPARSEDQLQKLLTNYFNNGINYHLIPNGIDADISKLGDKFGDFD